MPHLTLPLLSRRAFSLTLAGAGVTVLRSAEQEMHWALLSDTHIPADAADAYRGFRPVENLKKAVAGVLAANPKGALICGDLARLQGLAGDYDALNGMLRPVSEKMPVALALGNHDDRKNFLDAFGRRQAGAQTVPERHIVVVESAAMRFVVLDSLIQPNSIPGFLGKAQRTWLADHLKRPVDMPTLIFVHHPLNDDDGSLLDAPRLMELVRPIHQVKGIVFGHTHSYGYEVWQGIHLINLPAVGYNFADSEPVGWVEAKLTPEGGSFTLRAIGGNTEKDGKTTKLRWRVSA